MKKSITLCDKTENPIITLVLGHVNAIQYNAAFKAEGWSGDYIHKKNLRHEFWLEQKHGWKKATDKNPKAKKVTVSDW